MFSLYKNARDAIKDPDKNAYITNTFSEIRNVLQTDLKCRVTINDENWDHGNIKIYPTIKIVKYLPTSEDYLL